MRTPWNPPRPRILRVTNRMTADVPPLADNSCAGRCSPTTQRDLTLHPRAFRQRLLRLRTRATHYRETGDNDGNPWYDQHYAADVGIPLPQARAIADAAIERCDDTLDDQEAQASRAASQSAAAATSAARRAALAEKEATACGQIGGVLTQRAGGDTCRSRHPGRPRERHYPHPLLPRKHQLQPRRQPRRGTTRVQPTPVPQVLHLLALLPETLTAHPLDT